MGENRFLESMAKKTIFSTQQEFDEPKVAKAKERKKKGKPSEKESERKELYVAPFYLAEKLADYQLTDRSTSFIAI